MPGILRRALTLDFAVDVDDPDLAAEIDTALAGLPPARTTPAQRWCVATEGSGFRIDFGDAAAPVEAASDADVLDSLVSHLNMAAIGAARGHLLPHTGAVATSDGRVVLLPAPSGSGKSTLTAALVEAGLTYLSDETIGVDAATLAVLPYRKPLTLKPGSFEVHDHLEPGRGAGAIGWQVPVAALGDVGPPPDGAGLRVALVAAPAYHPDVAGGAVLHPMSRAEAVYVLATNSSSLVAVHPRPLESLARFVGDARACRVQFSDVRAARELVLAQLGAG